MRDRPDSRQIHIELAIQFAGGLPLDFEILPWHDPPVHERRKYESRLNNDVSTDAIPVVSLIRHRTPRLGGRGFNVDARNLLLIFPETSACILSTDFSR